jgi:hypothetical protein
MIKEYPLSLKGPSVLATLDGSKTQTRRTQAYWKKRKPGERLWIIETWWDPPFITDKMKRDGADTWPKYDYDASIDEFDRVKYRDWGWKRKPSIHMPRGASRIDAEIIRIWEERLQDISEEDAKAEGVSLYSKMCKWTDLIKYKQIAETSHRVGFKHLWESVYGPGSWDANPIVYPVEYKVI